MLGLETLYYGVPANIYQIGWNSFLVHHRSLPTGTTEIDGSAVRLLAACTGLKTLEDHGAACLLAGVSPDPNEIAASLVRLISIGLLRAKPEGERPPATPIPDRSIAVAIVTADRPSMLTRCLQSLTTHLQTVGRHARIVVVDGSRRCSNETRAVVDAFASRRGDIVYVGAAQAGALRQHLVSQGRSEDVVTATLTPGSAGNNRNLALLWAGTDVVVMVDDDVLCEPWASSHEETGIVVGGHGDLRESIAFDDRAQALATVRRVDADLFGAHRAFLGRSLADVISSTTGPVEASRACQHMLTALAFRQNYHVMATFAGIAGDGARYCPYSALLSSDEKQRALWESETALDRELRSREVQRVAKRPLISHNVACMSYCLGLEANVLMPPFIGDFRNADGVFGATLFAVYPHAVSVHLPLGILHDSSRSSEYDESQRMLYLQETRASDFLIDFISLSSSAIRATGAADRLTSVGSALIDLGACTTDDLLEVLREIALKARCQEVMRLERLVHEQGCPPAIARAADRYRNAFLNAVKEGEFFIPAEFKGDGPAALANTQTSFRRFGRAMLEWPAVRNCAVQVVPELSSC